jgi:hypothetical protein
MRGLDVGAGLDAQLLDQPTADLGVGLQRGCLLTAARLGQHQLCPEPLAQRMLGDDRSQFTDDGLVPAQAQVGVDALFQRAEPAFGKPDTHLPLQNLRRDVGQHRTAPQVERAGEQLGPRRRIVARLRLSGFVEQPLEPGDVDRFARPRPDQVAGRLGDDQVARSAVVDEDAAQPGHVSLERGPGVGGHAVVPRRTDQAVGRHHPIGVQQEGGEQRALPSRPHHHSRAVDLDEQRTEQTESQAVILAGAEST